MNRNSQCVDLARPATDWVYNALLDSKSDQPAANARRLTGFQPVFRAAGFDRLEACAAPTVS
jgi:hypothetical protein